MKAKARRRLAERKVLEHLGDLEIDPIEDPIQAFKLLVSETEAIRVELTSRLASSKATGADWRAELVAVERWFDRVGSMLSTWLKLGIFESAVRSVSSDSDGHNAVRIFNERMALMSARNEAAALMLAIPAGDVVDAELAELVDTTEEDAATSSVEVPAAPVEPPLRPAGPTPRLDYIDGVSNPRHARLIEMGGWDGRG